MNVQKNVLVVDDEPTYQTIINRKLKAAGYRTILVKNAEEAMAALWQKEHISLILLDIRLPVINGLNIFEIIRKEFPDKKIIVVSVLQKEEQRFLIYDADDYYDKSEDLSRLLEKVNNVFHNRIPAPFRDEKRNSRRLPLNVLASCERRAQDVHGSDRHFISYTKDLSVHGGKFIVHENLKAGDHFTAALELPVHFLPVLVDCQVQWVKKADDFLPPPKGNVEAGVSFVKLDSRCDEEKLKSYLSYA